jgi:type III pantothenate kinase
LNDCPSVLEASTGVIREGKVLIAVDIGNTTTMVGAFRGKDLVERWSLTSGTARTADEVAMLVKGLFSSSDIALEGNTQVTVASVVPSLTGAFQGMARKLFGREALVVSSETHTGIEICYRDPASVGADRIANAVAASMLHRLPAVVVDLGTATTFDVITAEMKYLGGAIAPGLVTSAEHLFFKGAKLSPVEFQAPSRVIGRTTDESLLSGIIYGAVGQVDEIVRRIAEELNGKPAVIGTGGLVEVVAPLSKYIEIVDASLTLQGLRLITEMS